DALLGIDGDGRIIATEHTKHTVALIDPRTLRVVAHHAFRERAYGIVQAGPFAVAYRPWSGHLRGIDWSAAERSINRGEVPADTAGSGTCRHRRRRRAPSLGRSADTPRPPARTPETRAAS